MLYFCIPVYNEAPTIGLLLWQLRKVFREYSREYEVLIFDDGSSDDTADRLVPYAEVLPLTILGGQTRVGYAAALDALFRTAAKRTRYPRRDAVVLLQGDFTERPENLPELIKRFEGGADIVIGERSSSVTTPSAVRRLRRIAPWVIRPFVSLPGISDPFSSLRLYRVSVVRDLLSEVGDAQLARANGWAANLELLVKASKFARRVETVSLEPRYDLRPRESRVRPLADAMNLYRYGWASRSQRHGVST